MRGIKYYNDTGQGTPLVLVHAFPLDADMWDPQRSGLSDRMRIITFDLPGFGRDTGPAATSMEECADATAALLDRLSIDTCVIGGCSMGGYIAMSFLRRHPHRVRGILLADTRAGSDSDEARASRHAQAAAVRADGMEAIIPGLLPKLLGETGKREDTSREARVRAIMERATPEGTARMLEAMAARHDSLPLLRTVTVPSLIIVGDEDILTPPTESRIMAEAMHGSELHVIPGAGHLANMEAPGVFNEIVARFIESC